MTQHENETDKNMASVLREVSTLLYDLRQGQCIHNGRFPDRKVEGVLWDQIPSVIGRVETSLLSLVGDAAQPTTESTRERKIKFIDGFGRDSLRVGVTEALAQFGADWLTDEQITDIVRNKIDDWRYASRRNARNRAIRAALHPTQQPPHAGDGQ
jgi:hypothetical protein